MLVGMMLFSFNDAMGKWLVATYSVGQVLLLRSLAALVVLAPFLVWFGVRRLVRVERPGVQVLRVVLSTAEVFCFYWAVRFLPLADVMAFWLAAPILVAALSPLLLRERVGRRRWTAILIGFAGVLLALGPSGSGDLAPTLVALLGTTCFALMMVTGRSLRGTPDTTLVFWQTLGALVAGLALAPVGWTPPTAVDTMLLCGLGVVAMLAHICVNRALKLGDAAVVAPMQYTLLPWAVLLGFLFFGDVPRIEILAGGAVIVAAGLYIFLREQRLKGSAP